VNPSLHATSSTDQPDQHFAIRPQPRRLGRVAVLFGGLSNEAEVSRITGGAVLAALRSSGSRPGPVEVESWEWRAGSGPSGELLRGDQRWPFAAGLAQLGQNEVIFLALHGGAGEDGRLQGLLELLGIRYTGSGHAASALAMDKWRSREAARSVGLRVAPGQLVRSEHLADRGAFERWSSADVEFQRGLANGAVIKPRGDGSSVGVEVLKRADELLPRLQARLRPGHELLVEARIAGLELTCAVLGDALGQAEALPPVEIVPKAGAWFDYQQKYSSDGAEEFCPPRSLPPSAAERLRVLARAAHQSFGCQGLTRSDFIWPTTPDGTRLDLIADPVFLEINTLPGLTPRSLAPQAARAAGIDYRELCLRLLEAGRDRKGA
jgi:D-alanine-D-alanine ligase